LSAATVELPGTFYFFHATLLSLVTLAVGGISYLLSGAFGKTFRRATHTQEELLQSHAARVKELTMLSAEIAHELKNPLASIKGLSALLVQNISDERGNERLRVLRREIDRMQTVLDEFLNFSRPLVPLSLSETDVCTIAGEVLLLHEGLARQKNVQLGLEGSVAQASCDPNKVKQVLINLVQNALDASPEGAEVSVTVEDETDDVVVRVEDQGPGIDGELGDVFAPGITSKSGGSGIGLTIARALARQHGGDLTLSESDGHGTRVELRLPKRPAAVLAREVA
jgi:signal transduction histidine kinase